MLGLHLGVGRPLCVLAIGAHADDVELGAGGTLLQLRDRPSTAVHVAVLSATAARAAEARQAADGFGANGTVQVLQLPDGRFPAHWELVKDAVEALAPLSPDVVIGPRRDDAHQDHRTLAEILPTVFREAMHLGYEIPKLDSDRGPCNLYVPLDADVVQLKWELLDASFPSQRGRHWWDREVVAGSARLRGVECRAAYAEGFRCDKAVLGLT